MFNRSTQDANISQIMKLINTIKQSIYKVVYLMMKQGEESLYLALFLSIIQLLQIQYLTFGAKILFVWQNTTMAQNINEFLKYFVISAHLVNQEFSLYITIFYIAFAVVMLAYILFILFAFTFKVAALPLLILKRLIHLFLTVAFIPFMLLFFGLLSCQFDSQGKNIWTYNHKIECWGNEHYIHGIFAIVIIVLFQILTSSMCLIFFESKNVYLNAYSCRSGRPYSQYHINVLVQIMSYQLLELPRFYTLLLFIYFGTSFLLFYQIHTEKPFYSKPMQKFWSIITALNVWTTIMEIFAYFLEGLYFTDIIYGWIGGIPLIILIIINEAIIEVDLLSSNINKPFSGQQIVILCEYLQSVLDKNDQHSTLILDAFLEIHKQTCYRCDCVLKIKKNLNEKAKHSSLQDNERVQIIIELISQIYYDGIKQFPQDIFLRLNYSYFLIDRLKLKQQALSELQQAELNGPSFDHLFTIYRYKRIMEDDLQEQQQDNLSQVDIVTEIAFQTQSKLLISQIEKTSLIFIDFWAQLQEEVPDIGRVRSLGFKILDSASQVQEQWNRLKRLNSRASKLNRLIGKYYTQILNDEEAGQKLIEQSRDNQNQRFNAVDQDDIYNEQLPTLTILTEIDKLGTISNVNKAACSLLGFTKTDLVNRKLNLIQPDLFSKYHDHFIENYLENISDYAQSSSDKSVFVKNKQGYIVPCQLNIRMIQTINSGVFMCGTLKQEIFHKPVSIFICLTNGIIENINASCIRMFGLELKAIQIRPVNIMEIFPDLFDRQNEFLSKNGGTITYCIGTRQRNSTQHTSFQDLEIENAEMLDEKNQAKEIQFQCYLQEIKFTCIDDEVIQSKVQGYIIKLEKIKSQEKSLLLTKKKTISNQQQFRVSCISNQEVKFVFEFCESQEVTVRIDQSIIWEDQTKISQIIDNVPQSQQQVSINLGDGIRTVRLQGDKIIDIDDSKSEELDDEVMQSVFQQNDIVNEDQQKEKKDSVNLYRSKTQLIGLLSNSKIPRTAKNFRVGINFLTLLITLVIFLEYFINDQFISDVFESLPLISHNNKRLSTALSIQSILQDLKALHYDEYPLLKDELYGYSLVETQFRQWFDEEIQQLITLQKELTLIDVDISSQYPDVASQYDEQNVQMHTKEGNLQNYTYNDAIQSIIAKTLTVNSSSLSDISDENGDVYFLEFNIFGSITQGLESSANYFLYVLIFRCDNLNTSTTAFLIASSILLFIQLLLILLFFIKLQVVNQDVLLLFLDLNQKKIKQFYQKCENFITSLQVGEDEDDFQSELGENNDIQEKNDQDNVQIRKKRRKFKNSDQFFKNLMLISILLAIFFEIYFVSIFITIENTTQNAQNLVPMFNQTSFSESYYRFSDNALRKSFEDGDYSFVGGLKDILDYLITVLYNLDAEIHQLHSKNSDLMSSDYLDVFNNIFILAPCDYIPLIDSSIDTLTCLEFNDGVLQQGLSIGMAKYFESFRQIISQYNRYNSTIIEHLNYNISTDPRLNYMMNLMNTNQAYNMRLMQERYVRAAYSYLNQALTDSIISEEAAFKNFKVAIFISCLIVLFFLFFFIWIPIIFKLLGELRKNRLMLTLISLSTIHETASIRQYIRKIINH